MNELSAHKNAWMIEQIRRISKRQCIDTQADTGLQFVFFHMAYNIY